MKVAFFSSVLALFLSLIFRACRIWKNSNAIGSTASETTATDIHQALLDNNKEIKAGFAQLTNALGGDSERSVVNQLSLLRNETRDELHKLNQAFQDFATDMAENNSKALIEALEEVMRDFNAKINEQFGENFKQLNDAVGKLLEWQENYKNQLEQMIDAFDKSTNGIIDTEKSMQKITEHTNQIPLHLEKFETVHNTLRTNIQELTEGLESFAAMKENAQEAFPTIQKALQELTENLGSEINSTIKHMQESTEKHINSLKITETTLSTSADHVQDVKDKLLKTMERLQEEHTTNNKRMVQTIQQNFQETAEILKNSVSQLDNEMQEEVTNVVTTMGRHVTSITNEFVTQYDKLMTNNIKNRNNN